jgi:hypothetical protein
MNESPDTTPLPPSPSPEGGRAPAPARRSGRLRFTQAFTDAASTRLGAQRLRTKPVVLIAVVLAALAVPLAIGAIPMLMKSSPTTATTASAPSAAMTSPAPSPDPAATHPVPVPTVTRTIEAGPAPVRTKIIPGPTITQLITRQASSSPAPAAAQAMHRTTAQYAAAAPTTAAPGGTFWAVTGFGCTQNSAARFSEHGRWTQGVTGFIAVRGGGLRADGCNGSFDAMPMSGSASQDDGANYAAWNFRTGAVSQGICHVSVYIPEDGSIEHVGGDPALYSVYDGPHAAGQPMASFTIDQVANQGRWASRGTYRITGGAISIKLHSRGVDWSGSHATNAHLAVSPVRVTCEA